MEGGREGGRVVEGRVVEGGREGGREGGKVIPTILPPSLLFSFIPH